MDSSWNQLNDNCFASKAIINNQNQAELFLGKYSQYIDTWRSINHPALLHLEDFTIKTAQQEKNIVCSANIQFISLDHYQNYKKIKNMYLVEKLFVFFQTIDLAKELKRLNIDNQLWNFSCLYLHSSNNCKWLPVSPGAWNESNLKTFTNSIVSFALALFDIPFPKGIHEWNELERQLFFPKEWSLLFQDALQSDGYFVNHIDTVIHIIRFVLFQSWIYTNSVKFSMRDR
ncbi:MAG: hypothetical protein OMM_14456, partial [Candidatus Magnetoglobus multicellularis str. Araruama]